MKNIKKCECVRFDTISSEESGEEEVIYVKHIPWRSKQLNYFVTRLDTLTTSQKSAMARRLSKQRVPDVRIRLVLPQQTYQIG